MSKMRLRIVLDGYYYSYTACMEIPELFQRQFEPIDVCDDADIARIVGGHTDAQAKTVMKTREDAAEILTRGIVKMLVSAMKKHDTHNGYKDKEHSAS